MVTKRVPVTLEDLGGLIHTTLVAGGLLFERRGHRCQSRSRAHTVDKECNDTCTMCTNLVNQSLKESDWGKGRNAVDGFICIMKMYNKVIPTEDTMLLGVGFAWFSKNNISVHIGPKRQSMSYIYIKYIEK